MAALRAIATAFALVLKRFPTLVLANLTAVVISAPLAAIVLVLSPRHASWVSLAAIVTIVAVLPNPLTTGIHYLTYQFLNAPILVTIGDQLEGVREYFLAALKLWLIAVPVTAVLVANIVFYGRLGYGIGPVLQGLWAGALLVWISIQFYVFPLLITQDDTRVRTTYRNAALLTFARPLYTLTLVLSWLLILLVATLTAVFVFVGLAVAAAVQQSAVTHTLTRFEGAPEAAKPVVDA